MNKIKVGLVGYGTIGKRVADAILLQPDMELVGITANSYNFRIRIAKEKGIDVYSLNGKNHLIENGIDVKGNIDDLLKKADIIVDCSPKPHGKENKEKYIEAGIKAIYQGGEKSDVGQNSFVAQCNYDECKGKDHLRVVSCNTTGLCRTLCVLDSMYGVESVRVTLIRRGTDPCEINKGPINAIVPTLELPSHHGPDVRTVLKDLEIFSTAVVVPTTLMHMHTLSVKVKKTPDTEDIIERFRNTKRIMIVSAKENVKSTAQVVELARDMGKNRGDMMDIAIWEEGVGTHENEIFFMQAVHQESDVVPENIDAIRCAMGTMDACESIELTNKTLGL